MVVVVVVPSPVVVVLEEYRPPVDVEELVRVLEVPASAGLDVVVLVEPSPAEAPFEPAPFELVPLELVPFEPAPFELAPFELVPFELVPFELLPFELLPVDDVGVDDVLSDDTPVDDGRVDEVVDEPVDASPVDDRDAEEGPDDRWAEVPAVPERDFDTVARLTAPPEVLLTSVTWPSGPIVTDWREPSAPTRVAV